MNFWGPGKFQIDGKSLWKSFQQVLFLILIFGIDKIAEWLTSYDFGEWKIVVVATGMLVLNLIRKFVTDYTKDGAP